MSDEPRLLDADPISEAINEFRRLHRLNMLAHRSGVSKWTIIRLANGQQCHVRRDNAERIAWALGKPLDRIYPELKATYNATFPVL